MSTKAEKIAAMRYLTSVGVMNPEWILISEAVDEIIQMIQLESAPVWTPCSDGLPTPEQAVIDHVYQKFFVTLQNLDGKRFVERCAYRCERWWMFDYQCYADETHAVALAWMPYQPEPYNPDQLRDTTKMVDAVEDWPEWKQRAALSNYKFGANDHIVDPNNKEE